MTTYSRRAVLGNSARLAMAATGTAQRPGRTLKAIFCGGHPGDAEYGCGGTIARYADLGHDVALLYLNRGECGFLAQPVTPPADRVAEAGAACRILKARPLFLKQLNGKAVVDHAHAAEARDLLEAEKPDLLFTQWPIDNHADHRAIFALIYEAWQASGKKAALYFYEVSSGEGR